MKNDRIKQHDPKNLAQSATLKLSRLSFMSSSTKFLSGTELLNWVMLTPPTTLIEFSIVFVEHFPKIWKDWIKKVRIEKDKTKPIILSQL